MTLDYDPFPGTGDVFYASSIEGKLSRTIDGLLTFIYFNGNHDATVEILTPNDLNSLSSWGVEVTLASGERAVAYCASRANAEQVFNALVTEIQSNGDIVDDLTFNRTVERGDLLSRAEYVLSEIVNGRFPSTNTLTTLIDDIETELTEQGE